MILAEGDAGNALIALARVPLTHHGRVGFQVENVLAAVAAAWALGVALDVIRDGPGDLRQQHAPGARAGSTSWSPTGRR